MWTDKQFFADAGWRALRTFAQTLYGLLIVVQITPDISIPWQGYLYSSAVAALTSLLQSIGRERVAVSVRASEENVAAPEVSPSAANYQPAAMTAGPGCGGDMR